MALTEQDKAEMLQYIISKGISIQTLPDGGDDLAKLYLAPVIEYSGTTARAVRTPLSRLNGKAAELQISPDKLFLQWRNTGQTIWKNLFSLSLVEGESAYKLWLKQEGNADKTEEEFLESIKGSPFIYSDFTPEQLAELKGETGSSPEFEWDGTQLRFKAPDGTWGAYVNLKGVTGDAFTYADFTAAQLASLKGDPGANIELQKNATHVQWRVVGSDAWSDLIPIADLKGDKGDPLRWADLTAEQKAELKGEPGSIEQGDAHNLTVSFTEAATRDNIATGETTATLFGKIKKWFSDLKAVAFTGDYADLSNTPTIPAAYTHPTFTPRTSGLYKITVDGNGHVTAVTAVAKNDITDLGIPAQDTDTIYTHPSYTSRTSGLYKITVDATGHISAVTAVSKADITALGVPAQDTTYSQATQSANGLMSSTDKSILDKLTGVNTVTTLASLPVSKRSITATLSVATVIGLSQAMLPGEDLIIRCVPSASFTQALPNTGLWTSMSGASIDFVSGTIYEISIWCYALGYYSIIVKEQE